MNVTVRCRDPFLGGDMMVELSNAANGTVKVTVKNDSIYLSDRDWHRVSEALKLLRSLEELDRRD